MCVLLDTFWGHQQVVPRQNGFHGLAFPATQETTQVGLVSPTLFIIVVDTVIRTWLDMIVDDQRVAHNRMGEVFGRCMGFFYAYYSMFCSIEVEWIQHLMNVLVGLFWRYGLAANIYKSHTMIFQPGALRSEMSEEDEALKCTGTLYSYPMRLRKYILCL